MQLDPSVVLNESRIFATKFIPPLLLISFHNYSSHNSIAQHEKIQKQESFHLNEHSKKWTQQDCFDRFCENTLLDASQNLYCNNVPAERQSVKFTSYDQFAFALNVNMLK